MAIETPVSVTIATSTLWHSACDPQLDHLHCTQAEVWAAWCSMLALLCCSEHSASGLWLRTHDECKASSLSHAHCTQAEVWAAWCSMLALKLTDGRGSCKAIEFRATPALSAAPLPPGTKLCITEAAVSAGILLLNPNCVKVRMLSAWSLELTLQNPFRGLPSAHEYVMDIWRTNSID